jgi:hypothetical protein
MKSLSGSIIGLASYKSPLLRSPRPRRAPTSAEHSRSAAKGAHSPLRRLLGLGEPDQRDYANYQRDHANRDPQAWSPCLAACAMARIDTSAAIAIPAERRMRGGTGRRMAVRTLAVQGVGGVPGIVSSSEYCSKGSRPCLESAEHRLQVVGGFDPERSPTPLVCGPPPPAASIVRLPFFSNQDLLWQVVVGLSGGRSPRIAAGRPTR